MLASDGRLARSNRSVWPLALRNEMVMEVAQL